MAAPMPASVCTAGTERLENLYRSARWLYGKKATKKSCLFKKATYIRCEKEKQQKRVAQFWIIR
ncbi:hypothetical protein DXB96_05545 [Clostridium sp. OM07-10AC]|nr:hypothetical protein DXB96_05545 [Clostridium sp. OM07-10AC]